MLIFYAFDLFQHIRSPWLPALFHSLPGRVDSPLYCGFSDRKRAAAFRVGSRSLYPLVSSAEIATRNVTIRRGEIAHTQRAHFRQRPIAKRSALWFADLAPIKKVDFSTSWLDGAGPISKAPHDLVIGSGFHHAYSLLLSRAIRRCR